VLVFLFVCVVWFWVLLLLLLLVWFGFVVVYFFSPERTSSVFTYLSWGITNPVFLIIVAFFPGLYCFLLLMKHAEQKQIQVHKLNLS